MTQTGYIYAITNNFNSDVYIGSTVRTIEERFNEHKISSRRSRKGVFHQFMAKNGIENFEITELKK
jgi:group I intron endonuclease